MYIRNISQNGRFYGREFPINPIFEHEFGSLIDRPHVHLCENSTFTSEADSSVKPVQSRILVVDDDPDHREILKTQLNTMGFECYEADNGLTGIAALKQQPVDLIISDYQMPEMDGLQMIQEIRSGINNTPVPIIFMTGNPDSHIIQRALLTGANAALAKPYSFSTLRSTILQLTGRPHGHEQKSESDNCSNPRT